MTTLEFGAAFREVLHRGAFSPEQLGNVGAHSLKSTTLSWLAKRGIDRDTRRCLGYHIRADERSMEAYSRDSLAGPLRVLDSVIREIAAGSFEPDNTRSGQLTQAMPRRTASSTSSSSVSRAASLANSSKPTSDAEDSPEPSLGCDRLVRNDHSKCFHVLRSDGSLACGRELPSQHSSHEQLPPTARLCRRCF